MTDDRQPTYGLRPPVQVNALPDDHPRVVAQVARIAVLSTRRHEYADDGSFRQWINPDSTRLRAEDRSPVVGTGNGEFRPPVTSALSGSPAAAVPPAAGRG